MANPQANVFQGLARLSEAQIGSNSVAVLKELVKATIELHNRTETLANTAMSLKDQLATLKTEMNSASDAMTTIADRVKDLSTKVDKNGVLTNKVSSKLGQLSARSSLNSSYGDIRSRRGGRGRGRRRGRGVRRSQRYSSRKSRNSSRSRSGSPKQSQAQQPLLDSKYEKEYQDRLKALKARLPNDDWNKMTSEQKKAHNLDQRFAISRLKLERLKALAESAHKQKSNIAMSVEKN